jgi:SHS2 domain-containing protein
MLSNASAALFRSMIDLETVQIKEFWIVKLEALDLEQLAYRWLSEIIFLFETESAVFASFDVSVIWEKDEIKLVGRIGGEKIDLQRHFFENEVKAVTMHQFEIKKNDEWCIQVILDV